MNLSKSKYCQGIQCKKILWLDKHKNDQKSDIDNSSVFDNGTMVGELAKQLFGKNIDIEFSENLNNMLIDTQRALENENAIITEASFNYNNNFCSVDILVKNGEQYEIYEVKSSTEVHDIYKDDISYQFYVLTSLGLNVTKSSIVHINKDYIRKGELDIKQLFVVEDVSELVKSKFDEVKKNIDEINKYMENENEPTDDIGIHCTAPYECPFFEYCTKNLDKPNVFDIAGMSKKKKFDYYHKNKYTFSDLLNENINPKYIEQIDFQLNDRKPKIDGDYVEEFLKTITYPIYFLDFETYQQPIPEYDYVKPYMQVPFQYSLHYIEHEGGKLHHKDFLGDGINDPRYELAQSLVRDIPEDACVLAYNMGFEKGRIKEMAETFPDLRDSLMSIHNNIKDLMIPFQQRKIYSKNMQGSYSIKYVLPALFPEDPALDYHNLDMVHNGQEAMNSYANLKNLSNEEREKLKENMLKYCELDTYAMVKIWDYLREVGDKQYARKR